MERIMNPRRSLAEKQVRIFSSLLAVVRFLACCDLNDLCGLLDLLISSVLKFCGQRNITLSNGVLPIISIIQYPYINGGKRNYTINQFSLNAKGGGHATTILLESVR